MTEKFQKKVTWEVVDEPRQKTSEERTSAEATVDNQINVTDVEIKELTPFSPSEERDENQSSDAKLLPNTPTETQPEEVPTWAPTNLEDLDSHDYYQRLGVKSNASSKEIEAAVEYRASMLNQKMWDTNYNQRMDQLRKTRDILIDPVARARHDVFHGLLSNVEDISPKEIQPDASKDTQSLGEDRVQVEMKPGHATDTGPLEQVGTAPDGQADDIGDKTFHHNEIKELDSQYPDHLAPSHVRREYFDLDAAVKESIASGDGEAQRIAMGRLDAFMTEQREGVRSKDTIDLEQKEGTPKENRNRFKEVMSRVKERFGMSELGEKLNGFLSKRSGELDAEAGKMGKGEKLFRTMGEKYNKLPMWQKVALGGSLAVGYGFTLPISSWLAGAYALPLFVTRVAAMAGSFENNRKLFETINKGEAKGRLANTGLYKWLGSGSEKNRENKAMAKALIQSFGMTLGLSYVAHEIAEHHVAERIGQWMVEHMPSKAPEVPTGSREVIGKITDMPKVAAPAVASEIPGIEVKATPGHGYEYMMKRLWEDLHEKGIKLPDGANQNSDLAQLLRADEKTIDGVVHRLAQDNEFFKGDGTSARINLDSKLTIDTNGQIWLDHENILAPKDAPVTPAYHAEVPAPEAASSMIGNEIEVTSEQATPTSAGSEQAVSTTEGQESQVPVTEQENSAQTPDAVGEVIKNKFELLIPTADPHIYANEAMSLFVYGGTAEEKMKMITEYLTNNPDRVLYAEDVNHNRVPWLREFGGEGKIIQGPVMRTSGLASIFSSFMKAPSPDDLKTLVK